MSKAIALFGLAGCWVFFISVIAGVITQIDEFKYGLAVGMVMIVLAFLVGLTRMILSAD